MRMLLQFKFLCLLSTLLHFASIIYAAQETPRKPKFLFDFIRPSSNMAISKDLRTNLPETKAINSPIYYIRMPPAPYTFIPGLGYVSNSQNGAQDLVNLPLPFLGNGRPVTIYQWSQVPLMQETNLPKNGGDSSVQRLDGHFLFNGKPNKDVFVLGDEYNSMYGDDVLNSIYP